MLKENCLSVECKLNEITKYGLTIKCKKQEKLGYYVVKDVLFKMSSTNAYYFLILIYQTN
jgi:hypothetical protein